MQQPHPNRLILSTLAGIFAVTGLFSFAMPDNPLIEGPYVYDGPTRLTEMGAAPTTPNALDAYQEWRSEIGFFGAFAVGPDGAYGYVSDYNTLDMAERTALAYCEDHGQPCQIIAVREPDAVIPPDAVTIGSWVLRNYRKHLDQPGIKAFATSQNAASGWSWDHKDPGRAMAAALRRCQQYADEREPHLPPVTCDVIHVSP